MCYTKIVEEKLSEFKAIDETHRRLRSLIRLRLPWLLIGLLGGLAASILVSSFEDVLAKNISIAFFVPVIVYLSDAVGAQTETLYVRTLVKHNIRFFHYLLKEFAVGILLGMILGTLFGLLVAIWLNSQQLAVSVGLSMFITVAIAPPIALVVAKTFSREHRDPALGAGPATTIIQDIVSLLIYFIIATAIIL